MLKLITSTALLATILGPATEARAGFEHGKFDAILKKFVKGGRVDYQSIKAQALPQLDAYLAAVAAAKPAKMGRDERLAFYLNAYNATVIRAVIQHLPISSVMKVKGFFDKKRHKVAGRAVTLNEIENKIIRPTFKEPRIHFALVCAARSCPPLTSAAFQPKSLDRTLDRLTRRFLNSRSGVRVKGDKATVSKLFEWYGDDFKKAAGSVAKYVGRYRKADGDRFKSGAISVSFHPYSWALNSK